MRFKRFSKVEVMNKSETPVSWRNAKILSGNGHTYTVQYDCCPATESELTVERVSRKFIRPCPPLVQGIESCVAGDIVEVFDDVSWKISTILRVLHGDQYLVRLLGCSQTLITNLSNTRMRQTWHEDKWIVMGKCSGICEDENAGELLPSNGYQKMSFQASQLNARAENQLEKDDINVQNGSGFRNSPVTRALKRILPIEMHNGHVQKIRAIDKEGRRQKVVAAPVLEKGYRHASFAFKGLKMMPGLPGLFNMSFCWRMKLS